MNKFRHHKFLQHVADNDVKFLIPRDISYGASWKMSGGRSAWFMLRRKMDRLGEIMKGPTIKALINTPDQSLIEKLEALASAEDIFYKIAEDPSGKDGTALAEIRDLRRYLLLVEAEMIASNAITLEPDEFEELMSPGTPEDGGHHDSQEVEE
jgi:hypothetical protein